MFNWKLIEPRDREIALRYLRPVMGPPGIAPFTTEDLPPPDYSFFPPNNEYQYRWYVAPTTRESVLPCVFLHIMTGDDPTNLLHDHDWDNTTHVLAGSMHETYQSGIGGPVLTRALNPGDCVWRDATERHSLALANGSRYAMTLFAIGPRKRTNQTWRYKL